MKSGSAPPRGGAREPGSYLSISHQDCRSRLPEQTQRRAYGCAAPALRRGGDVKNFHAKLYPSLICLLQWEHGIFSRSASDKVRWCSRIARFVVGNFGRCVPEYLRALTFLLLLCRGGVRDGLTQPSEFAYETDTSDCSRIGIGAGLIMKEPSS